MNGWPRCGIRENTDFTFLVPIVMGSNPPPILAITFFETHYGNDPLLLQYAHRVLEQHPVNLTFFFVPQVVQALRHDDLGEYTCSNKTRF